MNYNEVYLTQEGHKLLSKVMVGNKLEFTRIAIGDGVVKNLEELRKQEALISEKMSANINDIVNNEDGTVDLNVVFRNTDVITSFYVNEIGIFANDDVKGEILYGVIATGGEGGIVPAHKRTEESDNLDRSIGKDVEFQMSITVAVSDSANITIQQKGSKAYVTLDTFNKLAGKGWTTENVKELSDKLLKLSLEFAAFKGSSVAGMEKNTFYVAFNDFADDEEYEGVWDSERRRLGIYPIGGAI